MKVLFICRGKPKIGISPITKSQGESLQKEGVLLEYFVLEQRGLKGYLKGIPLIRKHLKDNSYDVIHAHYWLSGIAAALAGAKPLLVSLMGDDVKKNSLKWLIYPFSYFFWSSIIVKSKDMYRTLGLKKAHIVPNGVDMDRFKPMEQRLALQELKWDSNKRHILFPSDPARVEKNFQLAKKAVEALDDDSVELHYLKDVAMERVPYYYNASSVVILTSLWEGSPNAIKETMACSVPIVSTDVGDVKKVVSKTEGCYIASFEYRDFSEAIKKALKFNKRTTGREDIQYLKSEIVAQQIIDIYKNIKGI